MKHSILFVILALASLTNAEEVWLINKKPSGDVVLLCDKGDSKKIQFHTYFLESDKLSEEVAQQFSQDYPTLWKAATKSSGNTHNPKVISLRSKFSEVLLKTPSVRRIEKATQKLGYTITGATHEKLHIDMKHPTFRVKAIVWVTLDKIAEQDAAPNP